MFWKRAKTGANTKSNTSSLIVFLIGAYRQNADLLNRVCLGGSL